MDPEKSKREWLLEGETTFQIGKAAHTPGRFVLSVEDQDFGRQSAVLDMEGLKALQAAIAQLLGEAS